MSPAARWPASRGLWLALALGIAALFRGWGLGSSSLWLDEIGQASAAQAPWSQLPAKVSQHLSPPLDYAVSKLALAWGHGDALLRLPALFFSLLALPLFFALAARCLSGAGAAWSLWLLALSPLALQYAREARMYSLFLTLSLASWLLSLRFREKPSAARALAWGLAGGLALLTHYFAVFALLAQALAAAWALRRTPNAWKKLGLALGLMALCAVAWAPWALQQWRSSGGAMAYGLQPDLSFFKQALSAFSSASGFRDAWFYAFGIFAAIGLVLAWRGREAALLESALNLILSLLTLWLLSFFKPLVTVRNMIYLLPFYLLLVGRSLACLQNWLKLPSWVLGLGLVLAMAPALQARRLERQSYQPDWRGAAKAIQALDAAGTQTVWVGDAHSRGCLAWYLTPEADTVFMHARSLDAANLPGDRIKVFGPFEGAGKGLVGLGLKVATPLGVSRPLSWPDPRQALWRETGPDATPRLELFDLAGTTTR